MCEWGDSNIKNHDKYIQSFKGVRNREEFLSMNEKTWKSISEVENVNFTIGISCWNSIFFKCRYWDLRMVALKKARPFVNRTLVSCVENVHHVKNKECNKVWGCCKNNRIVVMTVWTERKTSGNSPSNGRSIWLLIKDRSLYIIPNLSHDGKAVREIEK